MIVFIVHLYEVFSKGREKAQAILKQENKSGEKNRYLPSTFFNPRPRFYPMKTIIQLVMLIFSSIQVADQN